jgi:hypothetical protein
MPLSWNEIRDRATAFAADWKHTKEEDADAKSFLDAFFEVFGVRRRKVASFEKRVKKLDGRDGYIDMLWKGTLLVEQKSRAYKQAIDYFPGLSDDELPRWSSCSPRSTASPSCASARWPNSSPSSRM